MSIFLSLTEKNHKQSPTIIEAFHAKTKLYILYISGKLEVSGKRQCLDNKTEEHVKQLCYPCCCDGKNVPAVGFCNTCEDYLCENCFKVHKIPRPCKNHILLQMANMPQFSMERRKPKIVCSIICPDHKEKVIEFFCPAHNVVLCGVCAVSTHKACDNVYVPDIAEGYRDSTEFKTFVDSLCRLEHDLQNLSTNITETISSLAKTRETTLQEVRQFRMEINDYLEKREQELILKTKKMHEVDTDQLQEIAAETFFLKYETSDLLKQLHSKTIKISDLFVTSKLIAKQFKTLLGRYESNADKHKTIWYTFKRNQVFADLISSQADFGVVVRNCQTRLVSEKA